MSQLAAGLRLSLGRHPGGFHKELKICVQQT